MGKKTKSSAVGTIAANNDGIWMGKARGFAGKFENVANAAAAPLNSQRIELWLAGFFQPEKTYEKVEKTAALPEIAHNLILFYLAYSLIFFLFMLALTSILPPDELLSMGLQESPDIPMIAFSSLVISPIVSTLFALLAFFIVFISARILGGKGAYAKQANSMSLVLCGSNIILLAFICLAFAVFTPSFILHGEGLPGALASIAALLINVPVFLACIAILLYSIYAYYLVVRKAHNLSAWKSVGALVMAAAIVVLIEIALNAVLS